MGRYLVILLWLALSACSYKTALEKFSTPEDRGLARHIITAVQSGDTAAFSMMHPELRAQMLSLLPRMRPLLPSGSATSYELVGAHSFVANGTTKTDLTYEVANRGRFALFNIVIYRKGAEFYVTAINITPLRGPLKDMNKFSLSGKSPWHYAMLLAAVASLVTSLTALILVFRTPRLRRKWLWALGCALAVGQVTINWSTGAITTSLLNVQLLGALAVSTGIGMPWIIGFGIPVIAIISLVRRPALLARQ